MHSWHNLKIAHCSCTILRSYNYSAQSWDCTDSQIAWNRYKMCSYVCSWLMFTALLCLVLLSAECLLWWSQTSRQPWMVLITQFCPFFMTMSSRWPAILLGGASHPTSRASRWICVVNAEFCFQIMYNSETHPSESSKGSSVLFTCCWLHVPNLFGLEFTGTTSPYTWKHVLCPFSCFWDTGVDTGCFSLACFSLRSASSDRLCASDDRQWVWPAWLWYLPCHKFREHTSTAFGLLVMRWVKDGGTQSVLTTSP